MGLYDTISIPCPKCGAWYNAQSKSGECTLKVMSLDEAIEDNDPALYDINRHAPFLCNVCYAYFRVELKGTMTAVPVILNITGD